MNMITSQESVTLIQMHSWPYGLTAVGILHFSTVFLWNELFEIKQWNYLASGVLLIPLPFFFLLSGTY